MENSREEDIKILEELRTHGYAMLLMKYEDRIKTNRKIDQAIEHILQDYKRVLKENEELKILEDDIQDKRIVYIDTPEFEENYISKQKIKDKLEELNKEIKSCTEIDAIFKIKQQQILQELLESEE